MPPLRTAKYYPYRKLSNELLCIPKPSNHPPFITKKIPATVSKGISNISCDKKCFDKATPDFNNALKTSGFNENHTTTSSKKKTQQTHFTVYLQREDQH